MASTILPALGRAWGPVPSHAFQGVLAANLRPAAAVDWANCHNCHRRDVEGNVEHADVQACDKLSGGTDQLVGEEEQLTCEVATLCCNQRSRLGGVEELSQ